MHYRLSLLETIQFWQEFEICQVTNLDRLQEIGNTDFVLK